MAETLLNVKNLTKKFEGHTILDGMDLEIKQGEVVVVVGPSGCGFVVSMHWSQFREEKSVFKELWLSMAARIWHRFVRR